MTPRRPSRPPEDFCPICGREHRALERCPETVLRAIDAAHRRDPDDDRPRRRSLGRKLEEADVYRELEEDTEDWEDIEE